MTDPAPLVSIVFLAYNRRGELEISLGKVTRELDYPASSLELIVVDNASSDGTADMVRERFPAVQVIRNPENVGASAWNVGMATARGEWRMILDDDCYIEGDSLRRAVEAASKHSADLVSFRVRSGDTDHFFNDEYRTGLLTFWGCSAMFSARVIENEPFYDPNIFIWANEMELTMRLLDRGYRHLFLPEVESVHMKEPSPPFVEKVARVNARHFSYIAAKHMRVGDAVLAVGNVALNLVFEAYSKDRRALGGLAEIPAGLIMGLRHRRPVRPAVSRAYRRNTWHFTNQLRLVRSPIERLRGVSDPAGSREAGSARVDRWYGRRDRFYPTSAATLDL